MKHILKLAGVAAVAAMLVSSPLGDASAMTGVPVVAVKAAMQAQGAAASDDWQHVQYVDTCKRRRFYNPGVFLSGKLRHLDPNYGYMNHGVCLDPPSHKPSAKRSRRLSCAHVRDLLLKRGYRGIKMRDCAGDTYGYTAYYGNRWFKLWVRARNGSIKARTRI